MVRIHGVTLEKGFIACLTFTDGTEKVVDLEKYLHGPIFERVKKDRAFFEAVQVDQQLGTIVWPNGADIDPDVLYHDLTPAWMEGDSLGS
jgi:hypothetical protein